VIDAEVDVVGLVGRLPRTMVGFAVVVAVVRVLNAV